MLHLLLGGIWVDIFSDLALRLLLLLDLLLWLLDSLCGLCGGWVGGEGVKETRE